MRIFESIITVTEKDLDELNHVNNIRYVEWVQEIAKQHWLKKASQDTLENFFWVMTNHCIEYKNEAFLNESIKLKTYIKKYSGATCTRVVEITNNESNTVLAISETKWCLINVKTKRPARITSEITDLFM